MESPFRQGGTNLGNYNHSIYNGTSSSEDRADFQARRLNARVLQIGGSRKTLATESQGIDIDTTPRQILGGLTSTMPSPNSWGLHGMQLHHQRHGRLVVSNKSASVAQPPLWQIRRLRGTTALSSTTQPPCCRQEGRLRGTATLPSNFSLTVSAMLGGTPPSSHSV